MKECSRCKRIMAMDMFNKGSNKDGLRGMCKPCESIKGKEWRENNKEHKRQQNKLYRENNKEKIAEYAKKYRAENKEKSKEYGKKWREDNKKYKAMKDKEYRRDNLEARMEYEQKYRDNNKDKARKYREDNKEVISARMTKYYEINRLELARKREPYKEELSRYSQEWAKSNPEKVKRYRQVRKALKKELPATLTIEEWELIKDDFDYRCAYCGKKEILTQEHFIPLSKGGEYTHNNIIPVCGVCNSSKNNRNFIDWYPAFRHYSKEREEFIYKYLGYKNGTQQLIMGMESNDGI